MEQGGVAAVWSAEQQAANRAKWVAALRSGEFKQGRKQLRSRDDEFCCLGVACELAAREDVIGPFSGGRYASEGMVLPDPVLAWLGLTDNLGEAVDRHRVDSPNGSTSLRRMLTELNDNGWSFDQIADLIESGGVKVQGGAS